MAIILAGAALASCEHSNEKSDILEKSTPSETKSLEASIEADTGPLMALKPKDHPGDVPGEPLLVYAAKVQNISDWTNIKAIGQPRPTVVGGDTFRTICTATHVSPEVLITAAHCISPNPAGAESRRTLNRGEDFQVDTGDANVVVKAYCDRHPDYVGGQGSTKDWALCVTDKKYNLPSGARFEKIATSRNTNSSYQTSEITLLGYGCIGFQDPDDAIYRGNLDAVTSASYNSLHGKHLYYDVEEHLYIGQSVVSRYDHNGFISTNDGALLCPGDSGGAAYSSDDVATRKIIGINSLAALAHPDVDSSSIATTLNPVFDRWARNWAIQHRVDICGVSDLNAGCTN